MVRLGVPEDTHRRLIRSESILLKDSVRLRVPKRWCQLASEDQGGIVKKNSLSCSRAFSQVDPSFRSLVDGCLTANHPFVSCSASSLINLNQFSSSPEGIRSGFVRTPTRDQPEGSQGRGGLRTNGPLSIWIILLCHMMSSLVFKIGCVGD